MAKIDGIDFNNKQQIPAFPVAGTWTHSDNIDANGEYEYGGGKSVMALDIDWNGAKPGIGEDSTTGITTTGELLSNIKEVYSPMFAN